MTASVAVAIMCKTPMAGYSKTRLSPPLRPQDCAALSACFIRDLAATIADLTPECGAAGYAVYTPLGTEAALRALLPDSFNLVPQSEGTFGVRLLNGIAALLDRGHAGAILVNSDSPTLPRRILRDAVEAVRRDDNITLSPALDGGYTLIGLSRPHERVFSDIPWSTPDVYRITLDRANEMGLPVEIVPGWYDVDDAASLLLLERELRGERRPVANGIEGAPAPATRDMMRRIHEQTAQE